MKVIDLFVKNIVNTRYDTLPTDVIQPTKNQILDTLGVMVAGTSLGTVAPLAKLVKEWGGKEESTIIGYGGRVPAPNAALVNGFLAPVLDYDDMHDTDFIHISRGVVPAACAMAERIGDINGKDFIVAVALGFDLSARLSRAAVLHLELNAPLLAPNVLGAAATASKLLKLNEVKVRNALTIAVSFITGEGVGYTEGASIKGLDGGLEAQGGILAALMAERGMTGVGDPIEGPKGFYAAFYRGAFDAALLTVDLGTVFEGTTNSQKAYPCCRFNGTAIDATLAVVTKHDINAEDVEEVVVYVGPWGPYRLCEPLEVKQSPQNHVQAQFSIPWSVANAILHRQVKTDHFTEEALRDAKTIEMAHKISCKLTPEFCLGGSIRPAAVEIKTKKGEIYSERVDFASGSPENPIDVIDKFRDCCAHAIKPVSQENVDKVIDMVDRLEEVADVGEFIRLLG